MPRECERCGTVVSKRYFAVNAIRQRGDRDPRLYSCHNCSGPNTVLKGPDEKTGSRYYDDEKNW